MVGRLHEGVEHVRQRHLVGQEAEEGEEAHQEDKSLEAAAGGELQTARLAVVAVMIGLVVTEHMQRIHHRKHRVEQIAVVVIILTHSALMYCLIYLTTVYLTTS